MQECSTTCSLISMFNQPWTWVYIIIKSSPDNLNPHKLKLCTNSKQIDFPWILVNFLNSPPSPSKKDDIPVVVSTIQFLQPVIAVGRLLTWKHSGNITPWRKDARFPEYSFIHQFSCKRNIQNCLTASHQDLHFYNHVTPPVWYQLNERCLTKSVQYICDKNELAWVELNHWYISKKLWTLKMDNNVINK